MAANLSGKCTEMSFSEICQDIDELAKQIDETNLTIAAHHKLPGNIWPHDRTVWIKLSKSKTAGCPPQPVQAKPKKKKPQWDSELFTTVSELNRLSEIAYEKGWPFEKILRWEHDGPFPMLRVKAADEN